MSFSLVLMSFHCFQKQLIQYPFHCLLREYRVFKLTSPSVLLTSWGTRESRDIIIDHCWLLSNSPMMQVATSTLLFVFSRPCPNVCKWFCHRVVPYCLRSAQLPTLIMWVVYLIIIFLSVFQVCWSSAFCFDIRANLFPSTIESK